MQTLFDRYHNQSRQVGRQEQGAAILLSLIESRLGPPSEEVRQRVAQAEPDTLLAWSRRILTAEDLDTLLH